jgi:hypothetical protein
MGLPDTDANGNLPPGRRDASVDDVRAVFVDPFVGSDTRRAIFDWWTEPRDARGELDWLDVLNDDARRHAVTLVVGDAATDTEQWTVELHRPAGPFSAQPPTADGDALAVDAALAALLDDVGTAATLGELVLGHGSSIDPAVTPTSGLPAGTSIDRHTLSSEE